MEVNTALLQDMVSTEEVSQGTDSQKKNVLLFLSIVGLRSTQRSPQLGRRLQGCHSFMLVWKPPPSFQPYSLIKQTPNPGPEVSTCLLWLMLHAVVVVYILGLSVLQQPKRAVNC